MAKQTVGEYCEMLAERWHIFFKDDLENSIFGTTKYSLAVEEIYIRLSEADENSDRSAFLEQCLDYLDDKLGNNTNTTNE